MKKSYIRAAAVQFGVGTDVSANLHTCLRMIDQAAQYRPDLMVLPEFVNHLAWYENADHCYQVAVPLDGAFLRAIAGRAKAHCCYIKVNVTLRRQGGKVTGTNILFTPTGHIAGYNDKQILMGNENNFLERATDIAPILATDIGAVGMYACMDGVIPEVARALAVRRPHLLLNSLNSFAYDEAALHIPVRAAENKVYVVAANKVGSLVPEALRQAVATRLKIDPEFLEGAGESQIVAPDGTVLARAPRKGEAVIWAEIDVRLAENKMRPDGVDIFRARRPELYQPLGAPTQDNSRLPGADSLLAGVVQIAAPGQTAVAAAQQWVAQAEAQAVKLVILPELFHLDNLHDLAQAETASQVMIAAIQSVMQHCLVATSIVQDRTHMGVLFNKEQIVLRQPQLHPSGRHPWSRLGDQVNVAQMAWGRVALVVGGDAIFPEVFRLAALQQVDVVGVPTQILEPWEATLGFPERAAENRINVVVGSKSHSGIYAITEDFTLWTEWKKRPFDGNINTPLVTMSTGAGLTTALLYPAVAMNKMVSLRTNLLHGRPWHLAAPLISS
ncbi:MAG: carbon-nitrogen hydrolase [Chloroflexi bacterium]|nr:carbon-nitrogen hydrolase [Ardenticatenaceae bacterium]MBL1127930.1 carbon-nitrogen hydrolase [Chloroflexota bacterium]NOG34001.1 carbon-nitrogen hydrolase [Chloroflexota bacterium]GIK55686.1 MAG: hypothetical protein BroJett015_13490 [Chloroflexota bacterium]